MLEKFEKKFDSKLMGYKNRKYSLLKTVALLVGVFVVGYGVGALIH